MYSEYINDKKKEEIEIKPSKSQKEKKKINGDIFVYIIVFAMVAVFIGFIVYKVITTRHYTDQEIETKLVEKAKEYVTTNSVNTETYLDSVKLGIEVNKSCSKMSGVLYHNNNYYPNMMCKDYKSDLSNFANKDEKMKINGDSFIVIPEGVTFYDPLYSLEYSVRRFGIVGESEGIYNIEYYAIDNDISVGSAKRKVIVVKNDEEKELYPKIALSGDADYKLDKGTEYRDPGVRATDSSNHNLEVKTYHNIDSLKEGTYLVTYEAKDEQGRTSFARRNVTVTNNGYDITVNVLKDPSEKTNKEVTIRLEITGKSYQKTILPDNTESTSRNVYYKVSENNTYIFKIIDTQNKEITKEVVVDNISKDKPTGTCEAKVGDNVTVTVSATSTNPIAGYKYKIDSHQSSYITDTTYKYEKKSAENVSVLVKDELGNETEIKCTINKTDTDPVAYIDNYGKPCIKGFVCYQQKKYNSSSVIFCSSSGENSCRPLNLSGCSVASMATMLSKYNHKNTEGKIHDPYSLVKEVYKCSKSCSGWTAMTNVAKALGHSMSSPVAVSNNRVNTIRECLKHGPVIIHCKEGRYSDGKHFMALLAVNKKGEVWIYNPATDGSDKKVDTWIDPSILKSGNVDYFACLGDAGKYNQDKNNAYEQLQKDLANY